MFKVPEKYRVAGEGCEGIFEITSIRLKNKFTVIASSGLGWEHVSVSLPKRTPTWEEMCIIKNMFWDKDDTVVQYHPAESKYVNIHPHCLHMWRLIEISFPVPPLILV